MPGAVPGTNKKAIWSLVLGIVGLVCCGFLAGIPAIILGNMAKKEIATSGEGGGGMATAGLVLGVHRRDLRRDLADPGRDRQLLVRLLDVQLSALSSGRQPGARRGVAEHGEDDRTATKPITAGRSRCHDRCRCGRASGRPPRARGAPSRPGSSG